MGEIIICPSPWLHGDLNFTSESVSRSFTQKM